ncbi:MAG TPA: AsmA-like C-terminal region-containing protein, partial [Candidatus Eisenbacteria bacterium]|nr:AsmA-like C-terminal region-containing protein [Candidatus Eisenbacteria bacterium]
NVDVVLERAFPGQGLPAWAGQVAFRDLSGTLRGLPFSGGTGRVAMNGRSADVQSLAMQIGRSDLNVHGTIPDVANPWFNFSLTSNVLDVDELTARSAAEGNASPSSDSKPARSPFGIAGDGPVRVGTLHFKQQAYQDVRANARLDQSGITLNDLSGRVHDGTVTGNLRVSPRDGRWAYEGNLVGRNMDAGSVLATWVPKANVLVGRMNGAVDLSGLAGKGTDAKKTLTMIGEAKIDGGGLRNISGLRTFEKYLNAPELTAETWPIRDLATQFEIRDGAAVFKGLHLEQEGFEWNLAGQIGFDGGLNLQGELRALPERLKLPPEAANISQYLVSSDGRIEVNFNVRGKGSAPNVTLDWEDLIEDAAGRVAQAQATGLIQRQLERAIGGKRSPADSTAKTRTDSLRNVLPIPVPADSTKPLDMFDKLKDLLGGKKSAPDTGQKSPPDTTKKGG